MPYSHMRRKWTLKYTRSELKRLGMSDKGLNEETIQKFARKIRKRIREERKHPLIQIKPIDIKTKKTSEIKPSMKVKNDRKEVKDPRMSLVDRFIQLYENGKLKNEEDIIETFVAFYNEKKITKARISKVAPKLKTKIFKRISN